jgi:molybdate transport system substrate-binding protein
MLMIPLPALVSGWKTGTGISLHCHASETYGIIRPVAMITENHSTWTRRLLIKRVAAIAAIMAALFWYACSGESPGGSEILVSAAISLKGALEDIGSVYDERTGVRVRFNFGASGLLQRQIEAGAPVDVFASAAKKHMDELQSRGFIVDESRRDFAGNRLVIAVASRSNLRLESFADLTRQDISRIAIGNPKTVPAGGYAKEALEHLGIWKELEPRLMYAENARQVLDYIVRDEVEAGFIYASDVTLASGKVETAAAVPDNAHSPIRYPVAVVQGSRNLPAAGNFIDLVLSTTGQEILGKHGFTGSGSP